MTVNGKRVPNKIFQKHIEKFYTSFCEQSIRCMFVCGFIPWRLRMISTGDAVPEVLPLVSYPIRPQPSQ